MVGSVASAMKYGSDLNYFLGLRLVAAMAAGSSWGAIAREAGEDGRTHWRLAAVAGTIALAGAMVPSLLAIKGHAEGTMALNRFLATAGRPAMAAHRRAFRLAEDDRVAILTDHGLINAHLRDRAPFVDPWLFRVLVESGRVEPEAIREQLKSQSYDYIITTKDLHDEIDPYDGYSFGLPPALAELARRNYRPAGVEAGLFIYVPRGG